MNQSAVDVPLAPGTMICDRYCLVGAAGESAFGRTYLARDAQQADLLCVLKEFNPRQEDPLFLEALRQRFNRATTGLCQLEHSQLPHFHPLIVQEQRLYWAREYIEGKSYGVLLEEGQPHGGQMPEGEVIHLLVTLLPVLEFLHPQRLVHGNLTPDSIIRRQSDLLPVLIDFGLAKRLVAQLKLHPVPADAVVTPWIYQPPESRASGSLSPGGDLYALGITAIALLSGKPAAELYTPEGHLQDWQQWLVVHPRLLRILQRLVHPHPRQRFASAAEVRRSLQPIIRAISQNRKSGIRSASAPPSSGSPRGDRPSASPAHRDSFASFAMVTGFALLIAVIAWRMLSQVRLDSNPLPASPQITVSSSPTPETAAPTIQAAPGEAADPADALGDRLTQAGINASFFAALVNEVFTSRYPQQVAGLQSGQMPPEWREIAGDLLTKLESLSPATRRQLGNYRRGNYDQWLVQLGEAGAKNSPRLDALADEKFFQLFPDLRGKPLNPRSFGQLWYAIAEEQLAIARSRQPVTPPSPGRAAERL